MRADRVGGRHSVGFSTTAVNPRLPAMTRRLTTGNNITSTKSPANAHKVHSGFSPTTACFPRTALESKCPRFRWSVRAATRMSSYKVSRS